MKLIIFSVYDQKADAYINPFYLPTTAQAIRTFQDCVDDSNHQFGKHPEDYFLYELGTFENTDASFELIDKKLLISGLEAKRQFDIQEELDNVEKLITN